MSAESVLSARSPGLAATLARPRVQQTHEELAATVPRFIDLRRDLHRHPELAYEEQRTAAQVAELLTEFGYEVTTGIAGTGVVGTLRRGRGSRRLGLRADMGALRRAGAPGEAWASTRPGVMHACGHDGHPASLLAAAEFLARQGDFDGTLQLIFQPAEEMGGGALKMLRDGLFDRFPVDAVYGLHNWPGLTTGQVGCVHGPAMASVDQALITVRGKGGHGAQPHETVDPVVAAAHIITALQTVVSRNVPPLDMGVVTIGKIQGGIAPNVIPDSVQMHLTARAYKSEVRELLRQRIPAIARAQAESFGATAEVDYRLGYPAVVNHPDETRFAREVIADAFGESRIDPDFAPRTASEDFAYLLQERPGAYLFFGNGEASAPLHSPKYDFNDELLLPAALFWVRLAERFLTPRG